MKKIYIILIMASYFFTGCAAKPIYYWGNYSSSLYKFKKTPNDKTLKAHKLVLVKIIEKSNETGRRVPPGVYCEYGYILMKEGKTENALKYYELEEQTYPESKVFIQQLKVMVDKKKKE